MDIATILGLVIAAGLLVVSVLGNFSRFIDTPSMLIVFGGTLGVVIVGAPLGRVLKLLAITKKAFFAKALDPRRIIEKLVGFGEIARRDGILALEGVINDAEDRFLVKGIQMAVDGSDPEVIQDALATELDQIQSRHLDGKLMFDNVGKYAPALGLIGTLLGLIALLANLENPDQIAPNMAIALITTLYGAVVANVIALPLADKLFARNKEEVLLKQIIIQGVISIQSGDNPKIVEQKLKLFLPPSMRGE